MDNSAAITLGICSDTHGEQMPQSPGRKLDAVLHAGDIYNAGVIQYGEYYVHPRPWAAALGVPVLAVRGNHDFRDPDGLFMAAHRRGAEGAENCGPVGNKRV
jgi:predicted phosphodiesterase